MTTNHEYTPTTQEVRNGYSRKPPGHAVSTARERHGEEFVRWHAAEIAAAKAESLREAADDWRYFRTIQLNHRGTEPNAADWLNTRADLLEGRR